MRALPDSLLVVTDRHQANGPLVKTVEAVLSAGARWIWLRDRDLEPSAREDLALRLRELTRSAGASLSIGADIELAGRVGADGVHLRDTEAAAHARAVLGPAALIGLSAHSVADAEAAAETGLDYVTLSPIFTTTSKPGYGPALGVEGLARAAQRSLPVYALGGLTPGRIAACRRAGAAGVAVMGGIMAAASPASAVREFRHELESAARIGSSD